jgi:hypothetical protein
VRTEELTADDDGWLSRVADIDPRVYRIATEEDRSSDWQPLIERGPDDRWWAGRFIGSITAEGQRLVIQPRLGIPVHRGVA